MTSLWCSCDNWKKQWRNLDEAIGDFEDKASRQIAFGEYTMPDFRYCPWCGENLMDKNGHYITSEPAAGSQFEHSKAYDLLQQCRLALESHIENKDRIKLLKDIDNILESIKLYFEQRSKISLLQALKDAREHLTNISYMLDDQECREQAIYGEEQATEILKQFEI